MVGKCVTSNPGVKTVGPIYFEIKYKIVIALQAYFQRRSTPIFIMPTHDSSLQFKMSKYIDRVNEHVNKFSFGN